MSYEGFVDSEGFDGGDGQVGVVGDGEHSSLLLLTAVYECRRVPRFLHRQYCCHYMFFVVLPPGNCLREMKWPKRKRTHAVCLVAGGNAMEQFDQKAVSSPADRRAQVKASTFVQESKSRQRNAWGGGSSVRRQTGIPWIGSAFALF